MKSRCHSYFGHHQELAVEMKKLENNLHRCKENKDDEILRPENNIIRCCQKFSLGLKKKHFNFHSK